MPYIAKQEPYTLIVDREQDALSPREAFDNFGTMVCFHNRYSLGDEHGMTVDEAQQLRQEILSDGGIVLPLSGYDHGGLSIYVGDTYDEWDGGRLGFIYATKEQIEVEFGEFDDPNFHAESLLKSEVELYDQYLQGDVWEFQLYKHAEVVESVGGFYGSQDIMLLIDEHADLSECPDIMKNLKVIDNMPDIRPLLNDDDSPASLSSEAKDAREASAEMNQGDNTSLPAPEL